MVAAPLLFLLIAAGVLLAWSGSGNYRTTGDEPHYLVTANGLITQHTLELTGPYSLEFRQRRFYPDWPPAGTPITGDSGAHVVIGPHGAYSLHNIGLPVLIAVPLAMVGVRGVRAVLVLVGCLSAFLAVVTAARIGSRPWRPAIVGIALTCSLPFLTAAGQVYPDLTAGVLFLTGCCGLLLRRDRPILLWVPFLSAACLPWLQVKYAVLAILLVVAGVMAYRNANGRWPYLPLTVPVVSALVLFAYDDYAYGNLLGPYGDGALSPGLRAMQTGLGLLLDQDQGLLFQNPLLLVAGAFGLPQLWRRDRLVATTVGAGAVFMLGLNALHPNWYGGTSFAGRFMWTSACILVLPAALLLADVWERRPAVARLLIGSSLLFQAALLREVFLPASAAPNLYAKPDNTTLFTYGILLRPLSRWLPALYNPNWSLRYLPNYLWLGAGLLIICAAMPAVRKRRWLVPTALLVAMALATGPSAVAAPGQAVTLHFVPAQLPALTGRAQGSSRAALPGRDAGGFLVYGPGSTLPAGHYVAEFRFASPAPDGAVVGAADVVHGVGPRGNLVSSAPVVGQGGHGVTRIPFTVAREASGGLQTRVQWDGRYALELNDISVTARW